MDPITSAVTLIALVTTTRKVLVTTFKICKDMNDAPDDLLKVSRQVKFVTTFLEQLIAMEEKLGHAQVSILPLNLREMLGQAVIGVQESIDVVVQTCQVCSGKLGLHIRLRWALLKKSEATKILQLLRSAMEDLSHVIQLLQLQVLCGQFSVINGGQFSPLVAVNQARLTYHSETCNTTRILKLKETSNISSTAKHTERGDDEQQSSVSSYSRIQQNRCQTTRSYRALPFAYFRSGRTNPGSSGILSCEWDQFMTTYALSIYLRLPDFLGHKALIMNFAIRQSVIYWTSFSLRTGTISLSNLVNCRSEIWKACVDGDEGAVRALMISRKASPYDSFDHCNCGDDGWLCRFASGDTVLTAAIRSGNLSLIQYLINIGADVNAQNVRQTSCLHWAFDSNHLDIARLLVYNGASADHVDIDGAGPLHYLRWRTSPRNCMTEIEWNTTIGIPFLDFMSALSIEDFNTQDDRGNTALKLFAWSGAFGTFLRALQLGASAHMEIFPQTGAISSLLHDSAFGGSIEIMEIVLRDNPNTNINDQDTCGMTPLHKAIQSPNMNIASIELLLSWGPDVSIRDNYGQTPLCCLISQPDSLTIEPVFNILVEYGASLGTVDCLGNTLLHHATRNGSIKWMELLLKQGCDVNARNVKNVTPLHYANTQYGFVDSCRFFGESYAEARQQDLTEVIDLLFSLGADPHIVGRFPHQDLPQFHNGQWREAYSVTESSYVYCTPASLARMCPAKVFSVIFHASLHQYYPETYIDSDDDVFWEASEHLDSPGEGSEMAVVNWRDEALSETELSNGIWNVKSYHLYDKAMLVKNRAR